MSTCAIIQARSSSKRLPNKSLKNIGGKTVIDRVVDRVRAVNFLKPGLLDEIVVAVPTNDRLWEHKFHPDVVLFAGSAENVLDRYYKAALMVKAEWILRVTGDCPLLDPVLLVGLLMKQPRKEYQALAVNRGGIIDGYDAELFSFQELERVYKRGPDEHCTTKMRKADENKQDHGTPFDFRGLKLSLDTDEDLRRLQEYNEYL